MQRRALPAHDAERHRLLETKGIADGQDELSDAETIGVAQHGHGKTGGFDLDEGEVDALVLPDDFGVERRRGRELGDQGGELFLPCRYVDVHGVALPEVAGIAVRGMIAPG